MAGQWADIPFDENLFQNSDETVLSAAMANIENGYQNEGGHQSRFPGLNSWVTGLGGKKTYLTKFRNNLIAATDQGKIWRIDSMGNKEDVTGVPLSGGRRVIFSETDDELVMAAGGPILRLASDRTEVLSEDAPETTHVAFVDGYLIAIEPFSGRWQYSEPGQYRTWPALNVFTAESRPDDLNSVVVSPYRELLLCGEDSIEQFERQASSTVPFFRRWTSGDGLFAPYTMLTVKEGNFGINTNREFVRISSQITSVRSNEIGLKLEEIDDWSEAWTEQVIVKGQKFIILQMPNATNQYGTMGVTFVYDYRAERWTTLFGWDDDLGLPVRWPGWSHQALWNRQYVGVADGVAELSADYRTNLGVTQRMLGRTGHVDKWSYTRINGLRFRFKRGVSTGDPTARIGLRVKRDNRAFGPWIWKTFGESGDRTMTAYYTGMGVAYTWQFEYQVTDDVTVELVRAQAKVERLKE